MYDFKFKAFIVTGKSVIITAVVCLLLCLAVYDVVRQLKDSVTGTEPARAEANPFEEGNCYQTSVFSTRDPKDSTHKVLYSYKVCVIDVDPDDEYVHCAKYTKELDTYEKESGEYLVKKEKLLDLKVFSGPEKFDYQKYLKDRCGFEIGKCYAKQHTDPFERYPYPDSVLCIEDYSRGWYKTQKYSQLYGVHKSYNQYRKYFITNSIRVEDCPTQYKDVVELCEPELPCEKDSVSIIWGGYHDQTCKLNTVVVD